MIKPKNKVCVVCQKDTEPWFSNKRCKSCAKASYGKPKPVSDKRKANGGTGELALFVEIYREAKGCCEITGQWQPFDPKNFAHLLSKGTRPDLRLERSNVKHILYDYHYAYDNMGKEDVLKQFPEAAVLYEWKEKLKNE